MRERHEADELRRKAQQGLGRGIVTTTLKGQRVIAVGNKIYTGSWKTVFEFLWAYLRGSMGKEWAEAEAKRATEDQHPIYQWSCLLDEQVKALKAGATGEYFGIPVTGASEALLGLAYNLYLLGHNVELQVELLKRLKNKEHFYPAYYETMVASWFILAGFEITLIADPTKKNVEFTARAPTTGKIYAVEAKARQPNKTHADVGNQLYEGLRKITTHERIVFIDINVPQDSPEALPDLGDQLIEAIKGREGKLTIAGAEAPSAFVLVTNHPYHYRPGDEGTRRWLFAEGFKKPDFGYSAKFSSLRLQFDADRRYDDVMSVIRSFQAYSIPATFDGEIPQFAYGEAKRRWIIGDTYDLALVGSAGNGTLEDGVVVVNSKYAHLMFRLDTGEINHHIDRLSDAEVSAYLAHPETFFSVPRRIVQHTETALEFMKFMHRTYSKTNKEIFLEWMKDSPNIEWLRSQTQEELALIYCEGMTMTTFVATQPK